MRTAPARGLPGTGTPPEALIKEARRRQRRRRVAIGAAVVAVLGSAVGVAAGLHEPGSSHRPGAGSPRQAASVPAPIPRSLGTTVLMWPAGFGSCCGPVAVEDLRGNPRVLGPTPFFAPSADPGRVWLFRPRDGRPTQAS